MKRAVFLDRDGVLVETFVRDGAPFAATTLDDFHIVPDAAYHVQRLRDAGLLCIVVTNQPELARGNVSPETVAAMHDRLRAAMPLDAIYMCPHDDNAGCDCRKPKPGMLLAAKDAFDIDLSRSFVIGDRWRDIGAGLAAGCRTVLIQKEYSACEEADVAVGTLKEAVDGVLRLIGSLRAS
jgi:D-glycero-D-manno-heptose 1,7-bisphosphate phosphatase